MARSMFFEFQRVLGVGAARKNSGNRSPSFSNGLERLEMIIFDMRSSAWRWRSSSNSRAFSIAITAVDDPRLVRPGLGSITLTLPSYDDLSPPAYRAHSPMWLHRSMLGLRAGGLYLEASRLLLRGAEQP